MKKHNKEGVFFKDITIEEVTLLETVISRIPNSERTHREVLGWLSQKVFELAEQGEVLSCYTEATEHALHPLALIPLQRTGEISPTQAIA